MKHRPAEKLKGTTQLLFNLMHAFTSLCELVSFLICWLNLAANPGASPSAALKENADPKLMLGSGQGHLLTRPYLEIRQESFNSLHREKFIYRKQRENEDFNHR